MSNSTASLKRKIRNAGDLQSVVRTMKALAASSITQYEQAVRSLGDYSLAVEKGLGACFRQFPLATVGTTHQKSKDGAAIGAIVFGSDQGLVGQFNDRVADFAVNSLGAMPGASKTLWSVGARVQARLTDADLPPVGNFSVPTSVKTITPLVGQLLVESQAKNPSDSMTELHLFYNRPTAHTGYKPVQQKLLPLNDDWRRQLVKEPWSTKTLPEVVESGDTTLRAFIREYLFVSLFRACAESLASENASRLAAMQRADKNIDELLEQLHGSYHRLRQSGIDEELFDVISGFEALTPKQPHP